MANMSYCRFRNTLGDLSDCADILDSGERIENVDDYHAMKRLVEMCKGIAEFDPEDKRYRPFAVLSDEEQAEEIAALEAKEND